MLQHGIRAVIMACFRIATITKHPNTFRSLVTWGKTPKIACCTPNNIDLFSDALHLKNWWTFFAFFSSSYAQQVPESAIQPLSKMEHSSESPGNNTAYNNQSNPSPEILMTLECNGNRTSVVTPIIDKSAQSQQSSQQQTQQNSTQQMTASQTPPSEQQHMNRTNWEPLTPPQ